MITESSLSNPTISTTKRFKKLKIIKFILFNGLARTFLKFDFGGADNKAPDRIKAFMADGLYTFMVFFPFIVVITIATRTIQQQLIGHVNEIVIKGLKFLVLVPLYGLCISTFNKDFYSGQSVINRLLGYKVVDIKTGNFPGQFKCMIRNLTAPILPFELPFVLLNPERRLGDFLAAKLIKVEKTYPELILVEMRNTYIRQVLKLAVVIPTILFVIWAIVIGTPI